MRAAELKDQRNNARRRSCGAGRPASSGRRATVTLVNASARPFRCRADACGHLWSTKSQACWYQVSLLGGGASERGSPVRSENGSPALAAT